MSDGKEHLAALKPQGNVMVLELMHYAAEIVDDTEVRAPAAAAPGKKELDMAKTLIANMTESWQPEAIVNEHIGRLEKVIADKVKAGSKPGTKTVPAGKSAQVINLMDALAASLKGAKKPRRKAG